MNVHCKRKLSVGPPNFLTVASTNKHSLAGTYQIRRREDGCCRSPCRENNTLITSAEKSESQPLSMSTVSNLNDQASTDPKPAKQLNDTVVVPPDPFSDSSTNANASQSKDIKANAIRNRSGGRRSLDMDMNGPSDLEFRLHIQGNTSTCKSTATSMSPIAKFNFSVNDGVAFKLSRPFSTNSGI